MKRSSRAGFSAFELGLCFLFIGVMCLVVVTYNGRANGKARDVCCASNLKQLGIAIHLYAADYGGRGPVGFVPYGIYPYVKNQQIFVCPANANAPQVYFMPDYQQPGALGYDFREGVFMDESPATIIIQDKAPGEHTGRTWLGVRLDGAMVRRPADDWLPLTTPPEQPQPWACPVPFEEE